MRRRNAPAKGDALYSLPEDERLYGTAFETFEIPLITEENRCGLQQGPINDWCVQVSRRDSNRPYRFLSSEYNCDGTVVQAFNASPGLPQVTPNPPGKK